MRKTCDHCDGEEQVLKGTMWWAEKHFVYTKCLACGHEQYYVEDE
ncbi:MAG: hypothetical protein ACW99G_24145 [Candidatus Thorarchaeota archaeon]|jgi:Zn ribbon nucleic-acid-binding protein